MNLSGLESIYFCRNIIDFVNINIKEIYLINLIEDRIKKIANNSISLILITLSLIFLCTEIVSFFLSMLIGVFNLSILLYIRIFKINIGNQGEKVLYKSLKQSLNINEYKIEIKKRFSLSNNSICIPDATIFIKENNLSIPIDCKNSFQIIKLRSILKYFQFNLSFFILNRYFFDFYTKKKMKEFLTSNCNSMKKRKYGEITRNPIEYILFIPNNFYREKLEKLFRKKILIMKKKGIYLSSPNNIKNVIEEIKYNFINS